MYGGVPGAFTSVLHVRFMIWPLQPRETLVIWQEAWWPGIKVKEKRNMPVIQGQGSNLTSPVPTINHTWPNQTSPYAPGAQYGLSRLGTRSSANKKFLLSTEHEGSSPHNNLLLVPIFSRVNHVHALQSNSYEINFNLPPSRNLVRISFLSLLHATFANCSSIRLPLRSARCIKLVKC